MKSITYFCSLILYFIMFSSLAISSPDDVFGVGANFEEAIDVDSVLSEPEKFLNKSITVAGTVESVCHKKGCWMMLSTGDVRLRIKVKDGEMVFPFNAKGKQAFATGQLEIMEMSQAQATAYLKHMAEDAGETFDSKNVTEELIFYQLRPVGVTIKR